MRGSDANLKAMVTAEVGSALLRLASAAARVEIRGTPGTLARVSMYRKRLQLNAPRHVRHVKATKVRAEIFRISLLASESEP